MERTDFSTLALIHYRPPISFQTRTYGVVLYEIISRSLFRNLRAFSVAIDVQLPFTTKPTMNEFLDDLFFVLVKLQKGRNMKKWRDVQNSNEENVICRLLKNASVGSRVEK